MSLVGECPPDTNTFRRRNAAGTDEMPGNSIGGQNRAMILL
jgi:hypothetical protein